MSKTDVADTVYGWPELFDPGDWNTAAHLIGSRCSSCGYFAFPPLVICPKCLSKEEMIRVRLSNEGVLENFSVVWQAPKGFTAPYVQAFVRLPEGLLIFTHLVGFDPKKEEPKIGTRWRVTSANIRTRDDGRQVVGYAFEQLIGSANA
jgi:uncharacterized OB-fold protein